MLLVLPVEPGDLRDLEEHLTLARLDSWIQRMKSQTVIIIIPRFKIDDDGEFTPALRSMGMTLAFKSEADFSKISGTERLGLSAILQRAYVTVDEAGTRAGAATVANLIGRGEDDTPMFVADHPFLFLVRDLRTGLILFTGRVVSPTTGSVAP